jgi:hypothetical protein
VRSWWENLSDLSPQPNNSWCVKREFEDRERQRQGEKLKGERIVLRECGRIRNLRYGKLKVSDTREKQVLNVERNFRTSEPRKVETREESHEVGRNGF